LSSSGAARLERSELDALVERGVPVLEGDATRVRADDLRVWVLCSRFNGSISARLCHGALDAFASFGIGPTSMKVVWVPGAFELPLAARTCIGAGAHGVACLGAVIRGETAHFDYVAGQCAAGIQRVSLDTGVPVAFGVLTTDTLDQALERSAPGVTNKGYEAAVTVLEMLDLFAQVGVDC
jgi:6,7-dimethyl-8-ribityllumazine synthase